MLLLTVGHSRLLYALVHNCSFVRGMPFLIKKNYFELTRRISRDRQKFCFTSTPPKTPGDEVILWIMAFKLKINWSDVMLGVFHLQGTTASQF